MKKVSKRKYFLMAVLSALCAAPTTGYSQVQDDIKTEVKRIGESVSADFDAAVKAAKNDGKKIVLEFSGLDWCPPCQMLHKFVTGTKEFAKYADKKIHFVRADFDRLGSPKNAEFASRHKALAEQFSIRGFPTIIVLDSNGKVLDEIVGFQTSSPKELIERIDKAHP